MLICKSIVKLELLISLTFSQCTSCKSSKLQNELSPFYCLPRAGDAAQGCAQKSKGLLPAKSSTSSLSYTWDIPLHNAFLFVWVFMYVFSHCTICKVFEDGSTFCHLHVFITSLLNKSYMVDT